MHYILYPLTECWDIVKLLLTKVKHTLTMSDRKFWFCCAFILKSTNHCLFLRSTS